MSLDAYFFIDASAMNCLIDVLVIKYSKVAFQMLFENIRHHVGKWLENGENFDFQSMYYVTYDVIMIFMYHKMNLQVITSRLRGHLPIFSDKKTNVKTEGKGVKREKKS